MNRESKNKTKVMPKELWQKKVERFQKYKSKEKNKLSYKNRNKNLKSRHQKFHK